MITNVLALDTRGVHGSRGARRTLRGVRAAGCAARLRRLRWGTQSGMTLIELLVTLVVAGVLLSIAAPSFVSLMNNVRLTSAVNDLASDLALARSEAAARGVRVVVCAAVVNNACSANASDWSVGRTIFADVKGTNAWGTGDTLLKFVSGISGLTITVTDTANTATVRSYLSFSSFGSLVGATSATVKLCSPAGSGGNGRQLVITPTGRTVVSQLTNCP